MASRISANSDSIGTQARVKIVRIRLVLFKQAEPVCEIHYANAVVGRIKPSSNRESIRA